MFLGTKDSPMMNSDGPDILNRLDLRPIGSFCACLVHLLSFVGSEELDPDSVWVFQIRKSLAAIREWGDSFPCTSRNEFGIGPVNVLGPEPNVVHFCSKLVLFVEPISGGIVVQLQPLCGPRLLEMHEYTPMTHLSFVNNFHTQNSCVESE
jgi:hypothetical protein